MSEVVDMVRRLKEPSTVDKFVNAYTLKVQNVAESKNKLFAAISQAFCDPAWYTDTGTFSWRGKAILKLLECSAKDNDSIPIPSPLSWLPKSDKLNLALLPLHAYGSKLLGPVEDAWVRDIIKHLSSQPHASVLLWPSMLGALARLLAANGCKVIKDAKDATAQSTAVHVAHLLTRAQLPQHGDPTHDDAVAMEDLGAVFAVLWLKPHSDAMRVFLLHMCNTLVEKRAQTDLRGSPVILKQATRAQVKPFVLQMLAQFPKNTDRLHIVQGMLPWLQWPAVVETSIKPPQQQQTKGVGVPLWISEILAQLGKLKTTSPTDMQWLARTYGQRILDSCSHADRAAANFNVFRVLFLGVDGIDNEVEDVIPSLKSIVETNENSSAFTSPARLQPTQRMHKLITHM
ncbi:hypothetical protein PTSG_06527 [Salpingoeca rosetta]|uniref:Uncharacterized protein n=1 Tax=Salpingoeca rosetta (strain ATCC 50818 / BSB-021) TaxID=946362 RepID=F2UG26_SALR5|nr:uncharacterized protein PTSG_06527 [Salpingoeca rosetta]EGD75454.1 hypothetical protein PTSG_06527 [Salpingoeca rosetta]|eukprot:XP_004991911.1 hypothetical protein PTSG_06527 [Salpingoeca rosetta]